MGLLQQPGTSRQLVHQAAGARVHNAPGGLEQGGGGTCSSEAEGRHPDRADTRKMIGRLTEPHDLDEAAPPSLSYSQQPGQQGTQGIQLWLGMQETETSGWGHHGGEASDDKVAAHAPPPPRPQEPPGLAQLPGISGDSRPEGLAARGAPHKPGQCEGLPPTTQHCINLIARPQPLSKHRQALCSTWYSPTCNDSEWTAQHWQEHQEACFN